MRNRRILPATCPSTTWPLSSCTLNIAFGSASITSPSNSTFSSLGNYTTRTFVAWGPLPDSPSSYSTFAPSASVRKPSPAMPEKCTKASFPPSSGVMNPKPFSSLNHFTTPVAIQHLLTLTLYARGGAAWHCLPACSTALRAGQQPGFIPGDAAALSPWAPPPRHRDPARPDPRPRAGPAAGTRRGPG